ncbi:MAG: hypothetical protein IKR65_02335, partial [Selenomonadaceae bacterium]|nr:hypothetical protein [Selenomonadaceae bacterium]
PAFCPESFSIMSKSLPSPCTAVRSSVPLVKRPVVSPSRPSSSAASESGTRVICSPYERQ